jgi:hypothetical protein
MAESDQTEAHATAERLADLLDSLTEEMSDADVLEVILAAALEIREAAESIEAFISFGKKGTAR